VFYGQPADGAIHFGAVFDGRNTIYIFGGRTNVTAGNETSTVLGYTISGDAWSTLTPMPVATAGSAAIKGADGKFLSSAAPQLPGNQWDARVLLR
jgi:hypothetical protein